MIKAPSRPSPWVGVGVLVLLLSVAWSLAMPLMASPDEPSHVAKAAAVARGQWSGELGDAPTDTTRPGAGTIVRLPGDFGAALGLPNCFAFQGDVPAACQQDVAPADPDVLVPVETFAGQYPPLYYLLVGWPSLFLGAEASIYAMRLVSAALTAGLLTWGAARLHRELGPLAGWGGLVAVTPMCLFLGATVNPQGLEIATAFAFWSALLAIFAGERAPRTAVLVQAAVTGAMLVNVRTSSPFWAVGILVVALVLARPGRWREVIAHRAARGVIAAGVVASVVAVGWVVLHPAVVTGGNLYPHYASLRVTTLAIYGSTADHLANMVGNFGWLDAPAPPLTIVAWTAATGALLLLGFAVPATRRARVALLLLVGMVLAAPYAFQIPTATNAGLIWQGRYALPLAVGVPLVAVVLVARRVELRGVTHRLAQLSVVVLAAGHVAAFYWASRRYSEGLQGQVVTWSPDWSSPIGFLPGVAAYAVVFAALSLLALHSLRTSTAHDTTGLRSDIAPPASAAPRTSTTS